VLTALTGRMHCIGTTHHHALYSKSFMALLDEAYVTNLSEYINAPRGEQWWLSVKNYWKEISDALDTIRGSYVVPEDVMTWKGSRHASSRCWKAPVTGR
jgi:hypothetical protein